MADPPEKDIQRTGLEAERLLAALNSAPESSSQSKSPIPPDRPGRRAFPLAWSLAALMGLFAVVVSLREPDRSLVAPRVPERSFSEPALLERDSQAVPPQSVRRPVSPPLRERRSLAYSSSCGSSDSDSGDWWAVLGAGDRQLLQYIRSNYCGDAYINALGHLQVASFNSEDKATSFVERLSESTDHPFRVGERYSPQR